MIGLGPLNRLGVGVNSGPAAIFSAQLKSSLNASGKGDTTPTYTRGGGQATTIDHEGIIRETLADEARFYGARRVENILHQATSGTASSEDMSTYDAQYATTSVTADTVVWSGVSSAGRLMWTGLDIVEGDLIRASVEARTDEADARFGFRLNAGTPTTLYIDDTASEWTRYSVILPANGSADGSAGLQDGRGTTERTFQFRNLQFEKVETGALPSEYVSVGVGVGAEEATNYDLWSVSDVNIVVDDVAETVVFDGAQAGSTFAAISQSGVTTWKPQSYSYWVTLEITGRTAGSVQVYMGNQLSAVLSTNAVHTFVIEDMDQTNAAAFLCDAGGLFDGTISNISIKSTSHGANVDGVKYFTTTNGNTVTSNVVDETVAGTAIAASTLRGYISESSRVNTLLWAQNPVSNQPPWVQGGTAGCFVVPNVALAAPDGETSMQLVTGFSADPGTSFVYQAATVVAGETNCLSAFFHKHATQNEWAKLETTNFDASGNVECYFDLANGVAATGSSTALDEGIEDYGNGWYRCWITFSVTSGDVAGRCQFAIADADGDDSVAGTFTDSLYWWGPQLEVGTHPSTYIPTEGSSVTRNADSLTYPDTDNIEDAAGTCLADLSSFWSSTPAVAYWVARGAVGRFLYSNGGDTDKQIRAYDDNEVVVTPSSTTGLYNNIVSCASSWGDKLTVYFNDAEKSDISTAAYSSPMGTGVIGIGHRGGGSKDKQCDGTVKNVKIYNVEGATL